MKRGVWILTLFLVGPAQARIGESLEECIERYGEVVEAVPVDSAVRYEFEKGDLLISCAVFESTGTCEVITYSKANGEELSMREKLAIMSIVKGEGTWIEHTKTPDTRLNTDSESLAYLSLSSLAIYSKRARQEAVGLGGL